nr:hypothetical protein [Tanacetum cinerariifolium]
MVKQNEVNELRAERLARNANPLALVATAQADQDQYYQTSRSHKSHAPSSKPSIPTRSHTSTRHKGKEIAKPLTPPSKTASEEDIDPEQAHRDKDMQKNLALIANNTCLVETDDSNVIPDSPDMCEDDIQNEQNDVESNDERVALAKLIANLKLDVDENKKIQNKSLGESISVRDSYLVALQTKHIEFEKYKAFNDRTIDYDKLELVKQKHNELMKQSLLTKSHYEGLVKQKTKVITDLKLREEHDIEKMLSMEKQLKFLNEIVYKISQSIQTIHMIAPKVPTYNGRPTFANPRYLKQAQSEIPCLYAFPYDQNTHANRLIPDGEETLALERESRSKLNKDLVRPYDYSTLNSLYEIFKPPTQEYET